MPLRSRGRSSPASRLRDARLLFESGGCELGLGQCAAVGGDGLYEEVRLGLAVAFGQIVDGDHCIACALRKPVQAQQYRFAMGEFGIEPGQSTIEVDSFRSYGAAHLIGRMAFVVANDAVLDAPDRICKEIAFVAVEGAAERFARRLTQPALLQLHRYAQGGMLA